MKPFICLWLSIAAASAWVRHSKPNMLKPFLYTWLFIAVVAALIRCSPVVASATPTPLIYRIVWVNDDETILLTTASKEKAITYYNDYKDHHSMVLWVKGEGLEVVVGADMFKHLR